MQVTYLSTISPREFQKRKEHIFIDPRGSGQATISMLRPSSPSVNTPFLPSDVYDAHTHSSASGTRFGTYREYQSDSLRRGIWHGG